MVVLSMTDEEVGANVSTDAGSEVSAPAGAAQSETGQLSSSAAKESTEAVGSKVEATEDAETKEVKEVKEKTETSESIDNTQTSEVRKYQADRDRAEQFLKEFIKKVSPFVEIDAYGNVIGQRKAAAPETPAAPQLDIDELMAASAGGDKEATKTLLWIAKEQAKRESIAEINKSFDQKNSVAAEAMKVREEFPDLYKLDEKGKIVESPLLKETAVVLNQRGLDGTNPQHIRYAALEAENRLIKKGLPDLEKDIRNKALNKSKVAGGSGTAQSSGVAPSDDVKGALTVDQVARLKKEGKDDASVVRIAKLIKQAQKEGGYYL